MESNLLSIISTALFRPHQYLDPGSGSFLIQLLIGGLVAVGFGIRMFWGRIKALFTRKDTTAASLVEPAAEPPSDDDITQ